MADVNGFEILSDIEEVIREEWTLITTNEVEKNSYLWDFFKYSHKSVSQGRIDIKYKVQSLNAGGPVLERGTIPEADARVFEGGYARTRYMYYPLELSGPEIWESKTANNMIDTVSDAMMDVKDTAAADFNRMFVKDGSGVKGLVATVTGSGPSTIKIDVTGLGTSIIHFSRGEKISVRDASTIGTVHLNAVTITSVDYENDQFVVAEDASALAAGDKIFRELGYDAGYKLDMVGIDGHIGVGNLDYGNYQGQDRTAAGREYLRSYVEGTAGSATALTKARWMKVIKNMKKLNGGKHTVDTILTTPGVNESMYLLLEADQQPVESVVSETGFEEKLKFVYRGRRYELAVSEDMTPETMYFINKKSFQIRSSRDLMWDGSINGGKLEGNRTSDIQWQRMVMYANLICYDPKSNGRMNGVKESDIT